MRCGYFLSHVNLAGGMVVVANLAEDLQRAHRTVARWIEVLERMYVVFTVRPFTRGLPRAVQKPPKIFFFDNGDVIGDEGARFENLVATHLLKRIQFLEDRDGYRYELRHLRDKEGREVDLVVVKDRRVEMLVEVKLSETRPTAGLLHFAERLKPERVVQVVANLDRSRSVGGVEILSPRELFADPPWTR